MALSTYSDPLTTEQRSYLRAAAEAAYPNEACGFFLKDGEMVELENRSTAPDQFIISASDYARFDEQIEVVWHTHAKLARFSPADIKSCKMLGLPFAIWDCASSQAGWLDPRQSVGLVGRPWAYGVWDCYAAVRDWYHQQMELELGDYPRSDEGEWSSPDFTHFEENLAREGFYKVDPADIQRGDMLLFRIRNDHTSNHVAVMEDPAQGLIFQHLANRLSGLDLYGHWLRETTYMVVRNERCAS